MTGPSFDNVTAALDRTGRKYTIGPNDANHIQASCPNTARHKHNDRDKSLSIDYDPTKGHVALHCFVCGPAGEMPTVRDLLGLSYADLFDKPTRNGSRSQSELKCGGTHEDHTFLMFGTPDKPAKGETWYPREWERGKPIAWKVRRTCKRCGGRAFVWRQPDGQGGTKWGKPEGVMPLGGLLDLQGALDSGEPVHAIATEGDSDAVAVREQGMIAVTAGGVNDWKPEHVDQMTGVARVTITSDADTAGRPHARKLRTWVAEQLDVPVRVVEPIHDHKDVRAHLECGHSLRELVEIEDDQQTEPEESEYRLHFVTGDVFAFDIDPIPRAIWGHGEDVAWPDGEDLLIAAAQGLGKTTIAQQLTLGRIGLPGFGTLFGLPIRPTNRVLYLAMDRPRQAARSIRRMVTEDQRDYLREHLMVWQGPPPADIAKNPWLLLKLCEEAQADDVILDSSKDAAIGLNEDEIGAAYNRARQILVAEGHQSADLHHIRKQQLGSKKITDLTLDDVYGSTWITAGAGSVILLIGNAGDPIVNLRHLKPPAAEIGPLQILHNDQTGRSEVYHEADLVALAKASPKGQITKEIAARALFDTDKPDKNQKEKAGRRLDALVASGHLWVFDHGDKGTWREKIWAAK
jgi:hypothetical protein